MKIHAMRFSLLLVAAPGLAVLASACGSSNGASPDGGSGSSEAGSTNAGDDASGGGTTNDASTGADAGKTPADGGAATDSGASADVDAGPFVEAVHPRLPLVVDNGGPTMTAPELTSVTFSNTYTNKVSDMDAFVATLGDQPYWAAATSEYGVGKPTVRAPAHLAEAAPSSLDDATIRSWLATKFAANDPAFGTATNNSLFVLYYPPGTSITLGAPDAGGPQGQSCAQFGGYHGFAPVVQGGTTSYVVYAVIPECSQTAGAADLAGVTTATSHEIVEAVTDPYVNGESDTTADGGLIYPPNIKTAYAGTSLSTDTVDPYAAWEIGITRSLGGLEVGDFCEGFGSSVFTPPNFPYAVQRTWSNAAVKAGKDPCAPYRTGELTYFAAVAVFDPDFAVNEAKTPPQYLPLVNITSAPGTPTAQTFPTQGIKIPVGGSATVPVILFADGPTAAWTVKAADVPTNNPSTPNLTFAWDKTTGQNGDMLHLTITVVAQDPGIVGNVFRITSTDGVLNHTTYGYVGQN